MAKIMVLSYHLFTISLLTSVFSFVIHAEVPSSKTDISALLSFKSQISGDPFGVFSSWNESLHHCKWPGVLCGRRHPDRVTALVLGSKKLSGFISPSLANLTFLQTINLSDNNLQGKIPNELGFLYRLRIVNMSVNFLEGGIPSTLGNCSKLEVISLKKNDLSGIIPANLVQCKELQNLDLRNNFLIGGIPHEFGLFQKIQFLGLSTNNLNGSIPSTLGNLSSLNYLILYSNRFSGVIPHEIGALESLQWLLIYENSIAGEIPHTLYNISTMAGLDLSGNQLKGILPSHLGDAFPNLQWLALIENQLHGKIPLSISNCSSLYNVELASNYFSGTIPYTIGKLKSLQNFIVDRNKLEAKTNYEWRFIYALTNCTYLHYLDLDSNQFQGPMPSSVSNLSNTLFWLSFAYNSISGNIPTELSKFTNLHYFQFDNMLLSGTIPEEIGNLSKLGLLDVAFNSLSGQIPPTFGNLTLMTQLFLNDNAFEGSIPPELVNMHNLALLNLSNNKITGKIPKEIMGLPSLSISLDLSHNYLTDILPPEISNLNNLQSIRLSNNKLLGEIPSTIGGCQLLQDLRLDSNQFQGTIPSTMSNIRGLQVLDVSNNCLSGQVPEFIGKMNLYYLNISFNNFEGELPKVGIFMNITGLDVRGNPKLCGGVPELHLPQCPSKPPAQSHHFHENIMLISSIVSSFIGLAIAIWLFVTCYSRKTSHNNQQSTDRVLKYELSHVSYNDLLKATENFSLGNLIGAGSFGKVYKALMSFENVTTVAVKVLNLERLGASRSFYSECDILKNVRHRNLIKVLSSCSSIDHQGNDFKALVFEYMPYGSLEAWFHPNPSIDPQLRSLNLFQRLNIAIDVASALDYLHSHGPIPIVHCDLKPSNVLLDNDMIAKVGDFGLAKFLVDPEMHFQSMTRSSGIKGSIGYIPPEYGMGGRPSVEGDVYSYGILLIEMFTGVRPTDERFGYGLSLRKHVEMALPEHIMDVVDSKLFSQTDGEDIMFAPEYVHGCLVLVLRCGLLCSKESPQERIVVRDILKELELARKKLLIRP